ncbi:MAG: hypothetical protein LBT64_01355 [Puniceicoccales bacterium]|jgi:hypothetical protein|nr:hypothetical protein [Puniceicoccales bacterium]
MDENLSVVGNVTNHSVINHPIDSTFDGKQPDEDDALFLSGSASRAIFAVPTAEQRPMAMEIHGECGNSQPLHDRNILQLQNGENPEPMDAQLVLYSQSNTTDGIPDSPNGKCENSAVVKMRKIGEYLWCLLSTKPLSEKKILSLMGQRIAKVRTEFGLEQNRPIGIYFHGTIEQNNLSHDEKVVWEYHIDADHECSQHPRRQNLLFAITNGRTISIIRYIACDIIWEIFSAMKRKIPQQFLRHSCELVNGILQCISAGKVSTVVLQKSALSSLLPKIVTDAQSASTQIGNLIPALILCGNKLLLLLQSMRSAVAMESLQLYTRTIPVMMSISVYDVRLNELRKIIQAIISRGFSFSQSDRDAKNAEYLINAIFSLICKETGEMKIIGALASLWENNRSSIAQCIAIDGKVADFLLPKILKIVQDFGIQLSDSGMLLPEKESRGAKVVQERPLEIAKNSAPSFGSSPNTFATPTCISPMDIFPSGCENHWPLVPHSSSSSHHTAGLTSATGIFPNYKMLGPEALARDIKNGSSLTNLSLEAKLPIGLQSSSKFSEKNPLFASMVEKFIGESKSKNIHRTPEMTKEPNATFSDKDDGISSATSQMEMEEDRIAPPAIELPLPNLLGVAPQGGDNAIQRNESQNQALGKDAHVTHPAVHGAIPHSNWALVFDET